MLDQADRARKMAEQELSDTNETLADLTVQNQSLTSAKRKLEQDLADLRHEADESHGEVIIFLFCFNRGGINIYNSKTWSKMTLNYHLAKIGW